MHVCTLICSHRASSPVPCYSRLAPAPTSASLTMFICRARENPPVAQAHAVWTTYLHFGCLSTLRGACARVLLLVLLHQSPFFSHIFFLTNLVTMKSLFFPFLATIAQAYRNAAYNDTFNASGVVTAIGYDIFSSAPTHLNWTFERRLYESDTLNFTEKAIYLTPDHGNFSQTADNWNLCWAIGHIKNSRKSTDPVPSNCKGVVSSDCLSGLAKTLCGPDGASSTAETQNACGGDLWIGGMYKLATTLSFC